MRLLSVSLLSLLIAGCATVEIPKEVKIPVPVPCIEALPSVPVVTKDADLVALGDFDLVITMALDRKAMEAGYLELRAVALACVK